MEMIMFQGGCGQTFRMGVEIDEDDPHNRKKVSIESLELRISGAFIDISGLIEICTEDLLKLPQIGYAMERVYNEHTREPSYAQANAQELASFNAAEASAINRGFS